MPESYVYVVMKFQVKIFANRLLNGHQAKMPLNMLKMRKFRLSCTYALNSYILKYSIIES